VRSREGPQKRPRGVENALAEFQPADRGAKQRRDVASSAAIPRGQRPHRATGHAPGHCGENGVRVDVAGHKPIVDEAGQRGGWIFRAAAGC